MSRPSNSTFHPTARSRCSLAAGDRGRWRGRFAPPPLCALCEVDHRTAFPGKRPGGSTWFGSGSTPGLARKSVSWPHEFSRPRFVSMAWQAAKRPATSQYGGPGRWRCPRRPSHPGRGGKRDETATLRDVWEADAVQTSPWVGNLLRGSDHRRTLVARDPVLPHPLRSVRRQLQTGPWGVHVAVSVAGFQAVPREATDRLDLSWNRIDLGLPRRRGSRPHECFRPRFVWPAGRRVARLVGDNDEAHNFTLHGSAPSRCSVASGERGP